MGKVLRNISILLGRLTIHPQQRCGFRKAQRQSEKKRGLREETDAGEAGGQKHAVPPLPGEPVQPMPLPPRKPDRLFRPLVFTVGVGLSSYRQGPMIMENLEI